MPSKFSNKTLLEWVKEVLESHASNECLIWPYCRDVGGYGIVNVHGITTAVHRLAFQLTYGHYPTPCALHRCDNPPCFNPRHLFEGTRQDNMEDKIRKNRQRGAHSGEQNHDAVLTASVVRQIRSEYIAGSRGHGYRSLSNKYGVCRATIRGIVKRIDWKHVI